VRPEILTFVLGPLANNTYLLADPQSGEAVVIDPSFSPHAVLEAAAERGWQVKQIWLTHAHFDHIAGVGCLAASAIPFLPVGLHPDDLDLYDRRGEADTFGVPMDDLPRPTLLFKDGQRLKVGQVEVEVRHAPGHTRGHVLFYAPAAEALLCGDVIFAGSVGRTDLPGGSHAQLLDSIRRQVLSLPPQTVLLAGHGEPSSVGQEAEDNPFLS